MALVEAKQANKAISKASKHRAILDDSDDEQEEEKTPIAPIKEAKIDEENDSKPTSDGPVIKEDTKIAPHEIFSKKAVTEKDAVLEGKIPSSDISKLHAQADTLSKLAKVEMSDKLEELSSPVKYEDLVTVFEKIEAISGRLEIQGLMTVLLRRILRDAPEDIYHAVYLASNSIAPAYECLELGIGDSILQKAIGEAYGTKAGVYRLVRVRRSRLIGITDAHLFSLLSY
jgi:DNA ligase-1